MFVAPLVEEPLKGLILIVLAFTRWFDNTTDGFVYGAAAGLGFAMSENILYFNRAAEASVSVWFTTVLVRTATSGLMHALATSIIGAALGWGKTRTLDIRLVALVMGSVIAVSIHMVWNGLIVIGQASGQSIFWLDVLIFGVEFLLIFGTFMLCPGEPEWSAGARGRGSRWRSTSTWRSCRASPSKPGRLVSSGVDQQTYIELAHDSPSGGCSAAAEFASRPTSRRRERSGISFGRYWVQSH